MMITPTTFVRNTYLCSFLRALLLRVDLLWLQLYYFATLIVLGFLVLSNLEPRNPLNRPKNYDLFFTSVSAATVSSMSTVEMEVFSNTQLVILAILMLLGGEVFTSMLELQIKRMKLLDTMRTNHFNFNGSKDVENDLNSSKSNTDLMYKSMRFLGFVVLIYFLIIQISAFSLVSLYIRLVPSAKEVLSNKGLNMPVFSTVTIISTFANGGFLPTNESMMVFKKDVGLLLILIPLVLLGNTMYPVFLRIILLILRKFMSNREELEYALRNHSELGYDHLFSGVRCRLLGLRSIGFIGIQFALLMIMEWKSDIMEGLNPLEKVIGSLFQVVNTRHTGESVFDLSLVSPAIIVLFATMMYLPPYTYSLPREDKDNKSNEEQKKGLFGFLMVSPLTLMVIGIVLVCISEGENLHKDPLNFSVLNIIFELISGYGNVGFSLGYSCKRQLQPHENCKDAWYGFAGRWNNFSKLILILVMIFGRLKKIHKNGGKA